MAKSRRVRSFNHKLMIQSLQGSTGAGSRGQDGDEWTDVEEVWGRIEPLRSEEVVLAREIHATATHRVETFYHSSIAETARLLYGSRVFNIESVVNPEERNRYLEMICTEVKT